MNASRRDFLIGSGSAVGLTAASAMPAWAASASRTFKAYRGRKSFGGQTITLRQDGSSQIVDLHTRLKGRILFLGMDYELKSREVWRDGVLRSIDANTRENDKKFYVKARRVAEGLEIDSTKFKGVVGGNPSTSSFFLTDLALRKQWISTQSGKPLNIAARNHGAVRYEMPEGTIPATHYYFGGGLKIPVDAYFDEAGELIGYEFDAIGARARVIAQSTRQKFRPLWG